MDDKSKMIGAPPLKSTAKPEVLKALSTASKDARQKQATPSIVTSKEDACPDDGAMLIVKGYSGCYLNCGPCTHICPECGWHYIAEDD